MWVLFEGLAGRLQETFRRLKGKGKLTAEDVNEAMREVRLALLEATRQVLVNGLTLLGVSAPERM